MPVRDGKRGDQLAGFLHLHPLLFRLSGRTIFFELGEVFLDLADLAGLPNPEREQAAGQLGKRRRVAPATKRNACLQRSLRGFQSVGRERFRGVERRVSLRGVVRAAEIAHDGLNLR